MFNHWKSIFSLLTLIPTILIYIHFEKKLNISTFIKAENHGVYADFKTNGTYIIKSGAWGSKKHVYGNYTLRDNIIEIDTSHIDDILVSKQFLIKKVNSLEEVNFPVSYRLNSKKYLVQLDETGGEIKSRYWGKDNSGNEIYLPYRLKVVIDNLIK